MNTFAIDSFGDHHIRQQHLNLKKVFLPFAFLLKREHSCLQTLLIKFFSFLLFFGNCLNTCKTKERHPNWTHQVNNSNMYEFSLFLFEENTIIHQNGSSFFTARPPLRWRELCRCIISAILTRIVLKHTGRFGERDKERDTKIPSRRRLSSTTHSPTIHYPLWNGANWWLIQSSEYGKKWPQIKFVFNQIINQLFIIQFVFSIPKGLHCFVFIAKRGAFPYNFRRWTMRRDIDYGWLWRWCFQHGSMAYNIFSDNLTFRKETKRALVRREEKIGSNRWLCTINACCVRWFADFCIGHDDDLI